MSASLLCDEVEALLPLIADGVIDDSSDPDVFAHLAICERCQRSLALHDLVQVSLVPAASALRVAPRVAPRPFWRHLVPAAALLAVAIGSWSAWIGNASAAPAPLVAATPTVPVIQAADPAPSPTVTGRPPAVAAAPVIDVEVVALPNIPGRPQFLVRRGNQVMMVDLNLPMEAPGEAQPATFRPAPHRY